MEMSAVKVETLVTLEYGVKPGLKDFIDKFNDVKDYLLRQAQE